MAETQLPETRRMPAIEVRRPPAVSPTLLLTCAIAALVIVAVGGYAFRWPWTGFQKSGQLWDVLHVVVLPVVLVTMPLWYRTRLRWRLQWRLAFSLVLAVSAVLVVGGYAAGWQWTGFAGNTLWDWLDLLALPIAVAFLPLWFETHARRMQEWRWAGVLLLVSFVVLLAGGYGLGWGWTGFAGNTLFDWLRLLIVPFVLPASLAFFAARREVEREDARAVEATPSSVVASPAE